VNPNVVLMADALPRARKQPSSHTSSPSSKRPKIEQSIIQLEKNPIDFDTNSAAFWNEGDLVLFLFLARVFDLLYDNK
ncbi:hypothetical protein IFM89_038722, partial [Coptis chinensis]